MQLVTLTTDFGTKDYYVAQLKAGILGVNHQVSFIDVSHQIDTYDIMQAAFFVKNICNYSPKNTIHVCLVNNYYSQKYKLLIAKHEGQYYIAPNNGLLSLVFQDLSVIYEIEEDKSPQKSLQGMVSHAIGCISNGLPIDELGSACRNFVSKLELRPVITSTQIRATIIHIDHFDNVIVNLQKSEFQKVRAGRSFAIYYKQNDPIDEIRTHFGEVSPGEVICYFNDAGYLTIGINMGKASSYLNLHKNETIQINFF